MIINFFKKYWFGIIVILMSIYFYLVLTSEPMVLYDTETGKAVDTIIYK